MIYFWAKTGKGQSSPVSIASLVKFDVETMPWDSAKADLAGIAGRAQETFGKGILYAPFHGEPRVPQREKKVLKKRAKKK